VFRRWVVVVLGAGWLVGCSGSNQVVPFEGPDGADGARDARPGADATMASDDVTEGAAQAATDAASDASRDASFDSSQEAAANGAEAEVDADASGPGVDAEPSLEGGPDAARQAGGLDAAPEAGEPDAAPDGGGPDAAPEAGGSDAGPCPVVSATAGSYVDGAHGVDDVSHGGGPGACAYRTITFAIAHAHRYISVAAGTYSVSAGETLPLVLTGRQAILCSGATIDGQGVYDSTRATIVFSGTANVVQGCQVVGDDQPGACVLVESDATNSGHLLEAVDVSHCGDAAVRIEGTLVDVEDSKFHDSDRGVSWSYGLVGDISNNTYSNNVFDDIACDDGDPDDGVGGTNNTDAAVAATCTGCGNCPFD
jgi:Protein of unknown function (DUF1565)